MNKKFRIGVFPKGMMVITPDSTMLGRECLTNYLFYQVFYLAC